LDSGDTIKIWKYIGKSFENNGFNESFPSKFDDAFRIKMGKTEFFNISKAIGSLNFIYNYYSLKIKASENDLELKKQALNVCKTVLTLENKYRLSFATESDKLRSASELIRWNKYAMALLFELNKFENVSREDAFSISERNKSIILLNTLKAQHAAAFGELPDSLVNEEKNLQKALSQIQKKLIETKDEQERASLLEKQNNLRTSSQNFKNKLEEKYPKYYGLKYSTSNVKTTEVQKSLPKDAMMIEYYIADSLIYIFTLTRNEIKILKEQIDPELLKNQIKTLRRSLSDYEYIKSSLIKSSIDFTESAAWFYEKLLSNALKSAVSTKHLIIIPDAELGHLPFEVFLTEKTKSTDFSKMAYLLNKYKISYNYSAALWLENLEQIKNKNNAKVFAAASLYSVTNDKLRAPKDREIDLFNIRNKLSDLPQARKEVEALEKLFYGKFLSGATAVESEFKEKASEYAVIHLAMHGLLNTQYPILSSLAFTENGDSTEDNFLQAYEVSNMKLNAQLVVLSACETGYGRFQQGEGVMSLARSFMYAGVPSLVVSLWQVNDASTAKIMQYFYKNLGSGLDKAEALRQAKLKYISENKENAAVMAHPAFWAAFVQLGDSRPIKLQQKTSTATIVLISFAILAGIFLSIIILRRKL
jgi:CHAT domain-containing protein